MSEIYQPKPITLRAWSSVPMEYTVVHRGESHGSRQNLGIVVALSLGKDPFDPDRFSYDNDKEACCAISAVTRAIEKAVMTALERNNEESKVRAMQERTDLMALFPDVFQVEELPNGYCSDWCCINLPWYRVLTRIGWITIGWRKRVINIDWSETVVRQTGDDLFPGAAFTVGSGYESEHNKPRYCHAWETDKAREQLAVILTAAHVKPAAALKV